MSDIQKARVVLAKWRDEATSGTWTFGDTGEFEWRIWSAETDPLEGGSHAATLESPDARLIVGTAGNPDLLDAIDKVLVTYVNETDPGWVPVEVGRIATAIIAADGRMSA